MCVGCNMHTPEGKVRLEYQCSGFIREPVWMHCCGLIDGNALEVHDGHIGVIPGDGLRGRGEMSGH